MWGKNIQKERASERAGEGRGDGCGIQRRGMVVKHMNSDSEEQASGQL